MTKVKLIGSAAILSSVLAGPATAHHVMAQRGPAQSIYCATREAGNPHSKYCDYMAWAKWRSRGGWDSRLDDACWHNPNYIPGECGLDPQGRVLFPASSTK